MFVSVPKTEEYVRIASAPAVDNSLPAPQECRLLRGGLRAKPAQEKALQVFEEHGELVASLGLGAGKTFILGELCEMHERPVLMLPGGLREKTISEFKVHGYRVPNIVTYDELTRDDNEHLLDKLDPDFIGADEAHRLTRTHTAARRLFRRLDKKPSTKFVPVSGTFFKGDNHASGLQRSGTVFSYALRNSGPPVPSRAYEADLWARALGDDVFVTPGCLGKTKSEARLWFAARLSTWPGFLHVPDTEGVDANLYCTSHVLEPGASPIASAAIARLRAQWELPDGRLLEHPPSVWLAERQLALGGYYKEREGAPKEWKVARRAFNTFCRETIQRGKADTMFQVIARFGKEYDVEAWLAVKDMHEPMHDYVCIDPFMADICKAWLTEGADRGVIWSDVRLFNEWLSANLGLPFYNDGRLFKDPAAIVSIDSYLEGANLQHYDRALLLTPMGNASDLHQLIGRHHRPGQKSEDVNIDVLLACESYSTSLDKAITQARDEQFVNPSNKVLFGNWSTAT